MAHYWLTRGRDRRMYDAARKLADCWDANIGPAPEEDLVRRSPGGKAGGLVRFGRMVNEVEGQGQGDKYIAAPAKFLLDSRRGGESYDQSHLPVVQQYEALDRVHALQLFGDGRHRHGDGRSEYQSAVKSIWDNIIHAKYYVTGGIGSEMEGFGNDFSLPNSPLLRIVRARRAANSFPAQDEPRLARR